jgi:hypothetical protein
VINGLRTLLGSENQRLFRFLPAFAHVHQSNQAVAFTRWAVLVWNFVGEKVRGILGVIGRMEILRVSDMSKGIICFGGFLLMIWEIG